MSFLDGLFGTTERTASAVLIDVGAESVAGAYVCATGNALPEVLYTCRLPVKAHSGEHRTAAMVRALQILGDTLVREGAPVLARTTGTGSADSIVVSIDAPWQETSVRTEHFEQNAPFVFTKKLVVETLKKTGLTAEGKLLVDESIIGTILNGYETRDPYGKIAHRATVVVLTSFIDTAVAKSVSETLQSIYHTKHILPIAGSSLHCQAVHLVFPHERDALIFDATGPLTTIALLRRGLFVSISEVPAATSLAEWMENVVTELADVGKRYPLPRIIFLVAREPEVSSLSKKLASANLGGLWLSDSQPKIVSVRSDHIVGLVRQVTMAPPDFILLLLTLFWWHSLEDEG